MDKPRLVTLQASIQTEYIRTHTFGIGSGCDFEMVAETAHAGRGSYSIVHDNSNTLNGLVVKALRRAFEPSLKDCVIWLGTEGCGHQALNEVFRNQTVSKTALMSKTDF